MANVNYDTLTIEINADSKKANSSINRLSKNLQTLEDVAKNLDYKTISGTKKLLQDIANIDFSNVSKGLQDVVSAFKTLNNMSNGKKMPALDPNKQAKAISLMTAGGRGFGAEPNWNVASFEPTKIKTFDDLKAKAVEFNQTLDITTARLRAMGFTMEQIGEFKSMGAENQRLQEMQDALEKVGLSASQAKNVIKGLGNSTDKSGEQAKKSANSWKKLVNAFKRVLFYRLVRRAIQMIGQQLKNGINEIAQMDSGFNESMSRITNSFKYLGNAVVSAIVPVIEAVAPIIEGLADGLAELANLFGSIMAESAGSDTFTEAQKGAEDYAESLEKVKSATLGIDELNVIGGEQEQSNFKQVEITPSESGFASAFADLKESLSPIFDGLKEVIIAIKPIFETVGTVVHSLSPILEEIGYLIHDLSPIIGIIVDLISTLINDTAGGIGKAIASIIKVVRTVIQVISKVLTGLKPLLDAIIKIVGGVINAISEIIGVIADNLIKILNPILDILDVIFDVLTPILDDLMPILSSLLNFFSSIMSPILDTIFNIALKPLVEILTGIKTMLYTITHPTEVVDTMEEATIEAGNIVVNTFGDIATYGEKYVGETINDMLSAFGLGNKNTNNSNEATVEVYVDSDEVARRVSQRKRNSGADTFYEEGLSYGK